MTSLPIAPTLVATTIDVVTVHPNGALVVRRGHAPGPKGGAVDVEVRGLPLLFASDTLRVRPARGGVSLLEETVRLESQPAPLPPGEEEREQLLLAIASAKDQLHGVELMLDVLAGASPDLSDGGDLEPKFVDARGWIEVLAASRLRAGELANKRRALALKLRDLTHERARLEQRMRVLVEPAPPRVMRGVRFTLDAGAGAFSLEYFVPAARWVPTYALQLTSSPVTSSSGSSGQARLITAALVAQASGEDWSGAALAVSTVDLARSTELPTLSSWRIGRAQPPAPKGFRALPSDLTTLFAGYDQGPRRLGEPPPAQAPPTMRPPPPIARPMPMAKMAMIGAPEEKSVSFDEDTGEHVLDGEDGASHSGEAAQESEEMAAPLAAPALRRTGALPSRAAGSTGGAPPGASADNDVVRVQSELPPRWRTASMRMAGPDESQRGSLLPLDAIARLSWLLESHDVDGAGRAELGRAVQALRQAHARMMQAPLPRGTSLLAGTSLQSVMRASSTTDVPSDGTFYRVEVRVDDGAAYIEHRAVPRASNDVWRVCRLDVKGPPLPPGPLSVYQDGAFKVNARLDMPQAALTLSTSTPPSNASAAHAASRTNAPGALDVNLGIDPDVRVLSRTVHLRQAEKGLMSQTSRVEHDVAIELRSTRSDPARVVVYDRLPVPADNVKDIVVAVLEETPPLVRTNRDAAGLEVLGAFEWRVTVMPGATQKLLLKYAIDLPAKAELEGGNRRE